MTTLDIFTLSTTKQNTNVLTCTTFVEQLTEHLNTSTGGFYGIFQTDDFNKAARYLRAKTDLAFVTRSERGSVAIKADTSHDIPCYPVDTVVDTTGAGDQYAAGFLLGLARGLDNAQSGALGSLAAAEVIAHWGPRPMVSLKTLAEQNGLALA